MMTRTQFMKLSPEKQRNIAMFYIGMSLFMMLFVVGMFGYAIYEVSKRG